MVAVVSGNGLGLFTTTLTQIGAGLGGGASIGTSRADQYVNVATGNLILTGWDESLFGHGMATGLVRTYNSQASFGATGADGWQTGYERTVRLASGTVNTAGSTVERATADGSSVTYTWDAPRSAYVSTLGDGAHDTITLSASKWLWTEGGTQVQETYTATSPTTAGKLEKIVDLATSATYDFTYTGALLTRVTGTNGETLEFGYDGSNRLTSVGTSERDANGTLVAKGQVSYGYDAAGRLSWVQTDLTPENATDNAWDASVAANNNGKSYRVSYTYADGSSMRITGVSTSDGVAVAYTYDGLGRIASVTQGLAGDGSAQTLNYTYSGLSTTVTDGAGRSWTYQFDGARQLTAVLEPAVDGQRAVTEYSYDASGNVTRIRQAAYAGAPSTLDAVYQYDANGNVTLQRDQAGNTITRTYNGANRVLTEARYTVADADGLDPTHVGTSNVPSGALVTRYIYDTTNPRLLRFVISATGEVTETQYNTSGVAQGLASTVRRFTGAAYDISGLATTAVPSLADMTTWMAGKTAQSTRTDFTYDAQGRLSQQTGFASVDGAGAGVLDTATSITRFTYDAQGLLRQQLTVHGAGRTLAGAAPGGSEVVDYVYDGLGRLLSTIRRDSSAAANDDANTVSTTTAYIDSSHQIVTTLDSGMVRTELRNAAGQLVALSETGSVAGSAVSRTAQNLYDASGRLRAVQDDTGARTYFFYDAAGRLSATVDATGAVTRTLYDAIGRVSGSMAYATRVSTAGWVADGAVTRDTLVYAASQPGLAGNQAWVQTDAANDRTASRTYDGAGRLATEVDAAGLTTVYVYDGADRLLSTTVSKPGDPEKARLTRYFYDADDRVVATLDPGGRVVETSYDKAGRVVGVVRWAGTTDPAIRATGTLEQLRPLADASNDRFERYLYDGRGNQVGMVDAEGYFTEYLYDELNNQRQVKAYAKKLSGLTGNETLAQLRTAATTAAPVEQFRQTTRSFNGLGQLVTEVNAEGLVTRYSYDEAGRLVRTETGYSTSEVRNDFGRYDVFGQLIGEMSGVQAAAAMATLGKSLDDPTLTEAQLDAVYAQFGVRHTYDALGRRTESVDASGAKTFYFYDAVGRQTFTVRGVKDANGIANAQGEVTEVRYTAFGQVREELAYTGRIAIAVPGSRDSVQAAVTTLAFVAATDTQRLYSYDQRGLMTRLTNAEGVQTAMSYSAFGQLAEVTTAYGTADASTTRYEYNPRGMLNKRIDAYGTALARTTVLAYDSFGNVATATDGLGVATSFTYDRLGRQVSMNRTVAGLVESTSTAYDAFDRIVSQTDARGYTTTFAHSDTARSMVVTTPEGVSFTTVHDLFGQTVSVSQSLPGGGTATTTTTYDRNGAVVSVVDALGNAATNAYDVRGLLAQSTDASGRKVQYTYDAAGRVLTRVEDPGQGGLNLTTSYAYDGQGRQLSTVDASNRVTQFSYDREGRLVEIAKDPNGLNLRTRTEYDATGRVFSVTEGYGTAAATKVQYSYDVLGRRTSERVDPDGLNLVTSYAYDAGDHLVGVTDALQHLTRFVYDEAGRLRFEIDATGAVTETAYDPNGNAILSRRHAKAFSAGGAAGLGAAPTLAAVQALVAAEALQNDAADQLSYRVLDKDNRVRFTLDAVGGLTETRYDSAGRVQQMLAYTASSVDAAVMVKLRNGNAVVADFASFVTNNEAAARTSQSVYDAAGRVVYTLARNDAGQALVSERRYDAAGRVIADVAYAKTIAYVVGQTMAQVGAAVTAAGGDAASQQRLSRYAYDAAGRLRFSMDDAGTVSETRYDNAGRVQSTRIYTTPVGVAMATEAAIATAVAGQPDARRTTYAYDAAGRLSSTTDALAHTETYGYDAASRRTSFTNKLGAVWTYDYDAAGRMTAEHSPMVSVARYDAGGNVVIDTVSIVTRRSYNALGQVLSVTENADTTDARTITYDYDARGRQVLTTFPDAWQVDANGALVATGTTPQVVVTYDALDRAVVQKDVRDNYSYKVYDPQGQLVYDIDEAGYVTAYTYDAFGEQTGMVRYANKIDFTKLGGWTAGQVITMAQIGGAGVLVADPAADRTLSTSYDRLGRKTAVTQSAVTYYKADVTQSSTGAPTTQFVYDAYGNLVQERVLLQGTPGQADAVWADTFRYYDELGRLIRAVDAEGYVTGWDYDAVGQVTIQAEFARRISTAGLEGATLAPLPATGDITTGYDRFTSWEYDALGRKTRETALRLDQTAPAGQSPMAPLVTEFGYDAEGRLTSTTVDGTLVSGMTYDALGRATSTTEAQRQVLRSDWQSMLLANLALDLSSAALYVESAPYTTMEYDAFGNAVRVVRFAAGDPASSAPDPNDPLNAVTTLRYDRQGRAVITRDAAGTAWYSRYDAADHVVDAWYTLHGDSSDAVVHTTASYDALGRQLTSATTRTPTSGGSPVDDASSAVAYNAFGEITAQGDTLSDLGAAATSKRYVYDKAGRLVTSNAETGTNRNLFYNLAGHMVREERSWTNNGVADVAVYITKTDKLGRAVAQILPSWTADANATTQVGVSLDRWSNVLRQVDARGNITEYGYNDRNQLIRQVAPQVKVIDEAGNESWQTPESKWTYDALGRLVASEDANHHARHYEYDDAGQLVRTVDATNAVSRQAYDAMGRQLATQNGVGYLSFVDYDRLDRAVAQGDLITNVAGTSRSKTVLQSFELDQNGNRTRVTDALGATTRYDYDSRGLLLHSRTAMNVEKSYGYDEQGRKILETDGLGASNTWTYDVFGRMTDHVDLGGANYDYAYDALSGLQTHAESNRTVTVTTPGGRYSKYEYEPDDPLESVDITVQRLNRDTQYYANGQVRRIDDGNGVYYYFEYDAAGNRTLEETKTVDGQGKVVHTVTHITYDSNNRISRVTTQDMYAGGQYTLDLSYDYDAVGNRRRVVANSAYGTTASPLDVGNRAPVLVAAPAAMSAKAGAMVEWALDASAHFIDPDGTPFTYSLTLANGDPVPSWLHMSFDAVSGQLRFRTDAGSAAALGQTLTLRLTATDSPPEGGAMSVVADFNLSLVDNSAPTLANAIPNQTAPANGLAWQFALADGTFTDGNGDALVYSALNMPAWMSFDSVSRTFSGVPSTAGNWPITVRVTDTSGAITSTSFTVTTPNVGPFVSSPIADQSVGGGQPWSLVLPADTFTDFNGQGTLTYSINVTGGSNWLSFNPGTRTLSGTAPAAGTFTVTVTASDGTLSASDTFTVAIGAGQAPNQAPQVAHPIQDQTIPAGQAWSFILPQNTFLDPESAQLSYSTSILPSWLSFDAGTRTFSGSAPAEGSWTITVTASDGSLTVSDSFTISIAGGQNQAPVLGNAIADQTADATGGVWSFLIPVNTFHDPEGGPLSYVATGMPSWMSFDVNSHTFSGTPQMAGSWNVMVTVTDAAGNSTSDIFLVTTPNVGPSVANAIQDKTVAAGQAWSFQFPTNTFNDLNGDALVYSTGNLPEWLSFDAGSRTFSGTAPTSGSWSITLTASDGSASASNTFNITINQAQNQAPQVANPIPDQTDIPPGIAWSYTFPLNTFSDPDGNTLSYNASGMPAWMSFDGNTRTFSGTVPTSGNWAITITASDGSLSVSDMFAFGVLANQSPHIAHPNPDQTGIAPGSSWSYQVPADTFVDPEGDPLTYSASGMPAWMSFDANTRTFSGTTPASGSWTVTVSASDGNQTVSDVFVVSLASANQPPVLVTPIPDQTAIVAGSPWSYTVPAGTFNDPEGATLSYYASNMPGWMGFNPVTRTFSNLEGLPPASGTYAITVSASDGTLSASYVFMASISTGQNRAPKLVNPIPDQFVAPNQAWSYVLPAGAFRDPDGNALTFSPDSMPAWMSFDSATRTFSGTAPASGAFGVMIVASDGSLSATDSFQVIVQNSAPVVANPIANQTALASAGSWSYTVPADAFNDPEGGALTFSAANMPAWMSFDAATRTFSGTPQAVGSWTVAITAQDPFGATTSTNVVVATPNEAPVITTGIPDMEIAAGQAFSYTFPAFTDPNGSTVTYTLTGDVPGWLSLNAATRTLSGTPSTSGTYALNIRAHDGALATLDAFVLTVVPVAGNGAPVLSNPLVNQTSRTISYTFAANTFTDPDGDALTYTYSVQPSIKAGDTLSFNASTRKFSGTKRTTSTVYEITVTANDGQGNATSASFIWGPAGSSAMAAPQTTSQPGAQSKSLKQAMQATTLQAQEDVALQALPGDPGDGDPGDGGTPLTPNTQTLWFKYDAENRATVVNGALVDGQIVVAAKQANSDVESYALQYNAAGNATSRTTLNAQGIAESALSTYTERGQLYREYAAVALGQTTGVVAEHTYDDAGREIDLTRYFEPGTWRTYRTGNPNDPETEWIDVDVSGWKAHQTVTTYDMDGRVSVVNESGRWGAGWIAGDSSTPLTALSNVLYSTAGGASGYDIAGRLQTYRYQKLNGTGYTHTYTTSYEARDTYLEKSVSGTSTDTNYKATTTTSTYDSAGRRTAITQTTPISGQSPLTHLRYFSYDAQGGILSRRDGTLDGTTFTETANSRKYFAYANGQQVATLGADGKIDAASQLTAFSSSDMGAEPTLVLEGDTLQSIAQRVYGNGSLWYVLAAANAVTDADLVAGTTLRAPQVTTTANDASTFKPYDPNAILGPTTPSLPYIAPPPQSQCNAMASVIRIFAVVVAAMTQQWYIAAAVAGGGETVAQTVEIQDGNRQGYNWAQVATSAVMAGFGASQTGQNFAKAFGDGIGKKFAYGATMAVASNVVSYTLNRAMGYEAHFSLRGLASDAIAGGISSVLLGPSPTQKGVPAGAVNGAFNWTQVAMAAVNSVVRQGISYGVHKAIEGHAPWNSQQVLVGAVTDAAATAAGMVAREKSARLEGPNLTVEGIEQERLQIDLGIQGLIPPQGLPAMGGVQSGSTVTASLTIGDQPRSTAISIPQVSYVPGEVVNGVRTLNTLTVTGDTRHDNYAMALWGWSTQYHMAGPPTSGKYEDLVRYHYKVAADLAPAWGRFLQIANQGQTVSVAQGTPIENLTSAQFGNQLLMNDLRGAKNLLVNTLKAGINSGYVTLQMAADASMAAVANSSPLLHMAMPKSATELNLGEYRNVYELTTPSEKAGETLFNGLSVVAGAPAVARMLTAKSAVGVSRVANSAPAKTFSNLFPEDIPRAPNVIPNDRLLTMSQKNLAYVVKEDGTLVVGKNNQFQGHIDLAGGDLVLAAGELRVHAGQLKYIDNFSGHYRPTGVEAQRAAENAFRRIGFDVEGKYIERPFK